MTSSQVVTPNVSTSFSGLTSSQQEKAKRLARFFSIFRFVCEGVLLVLVTGTSIFVFAEWFTINLFDWLIILFSILGAISIELRLYNFKNKKLLEIDSK